MENNWSKFVLGKPFLEFLQGDRGDENNPMLPYLTGTCIASLGSHFGIGIIPGVSRWTLMQEIVTTLNKNNRLEDFFSYILSKEYYYEYYDRTQRDRLEVIYPKAVRNVIGYINSQIKFLNLKFVYENGKAFLRDSADHIIQTNFQKEVDLGYIKELPKRIQNDLDNEAFDSVVTKSRTTLEEVFITIIESKGIEHDTSGRLDILYSQCEKALGITINNDWDKNIKIMLQGIKNIIFSIAYMRNKGSDSHGIGIQRINITKREAKLISNSAIVICEYLWDIYQSQNNKA